VLENLEEENEDINQYTDWESYIKQRGLNGVTIKSIMLQILLSVLTKGPVTNSKGGCILGKEGIQSRLLRDFQRWLMLFLTVTPF
jgi:hypothetical protein